MKALTVFLAACVAICGYGYEPPVHTNSYTQDGVTYAQRGGLGASNYVAVAVNALENDYTALTNNSNFKSAVATVSPPVELPQYWSLANITNNDGTAIIANDGSIYMMNSNTSFGVWNDGTVQFKNKNLAGKQCYTEFDNGYMTVQWWEGNTRQTQTVNLKQALSQSDVQQTDKRGTASSAKPISSDALTSALSPYITAYTASQTYQTLTGMSAYQTVAGMSAYQTVAGMSAYQTVAGMSAYQTVAGMSNYETTANAASKLEQAKTYADTLVSTAKVEKIYTSDARQYVNALGQVYELTATKQWHVYSSHSQTTVDFVITDTPKVWYSTTKLDNINMRIRQEQAGYSLEGLNGGYWRSLGVASGNDQTTSLSFAAGSWTATAYTDQGGSWEQTKQVAYTNDLMTALQGYVPTTRKINGQPLSGDITIQTQDLTQPHLGYINGELHIITITEQ